ncbi:MAG: YdjY domain-containing protein [Phycisphaerales bacterium]
MPNGRGQVEFDGISTLRDGWLEQVACTLGTREYESLVGTEVVPSQLHAALLLAGFEPGRPGGWSNDASGRLQLVPPTGDIVAIEFHWTDPATGEARVAAPADWMVGADGVQRMEHPQWRFGGSYLVTPRGAPVEPERATPDSVYVADWNGSVIGLVTFGDELLGAVEVIPDSADLAPPMWMVDSAAVPPEGTAVRVVLRSPDGG